MNNVWSNICKELNNYLPDKTFDNGISTTSVSGGCINSAYILSVNNSTTKLFIKLNDAKSKDIFATEYKGLKEILASKTIKVPTPIRYGLVKDDSAVDKSRSFIVLEYIELGSANKKSSYLMGQQLAKMHKCLSPSGNFGWNINNYIGRTPQINTKSKNWQEFYVSNRLDYQIKLARTKGLSLQSTHRLLANISYFFTDYNPKPSLLHGDLWAGNAAVDSKNNPVIYDPAVYYGDRETDIAFTEMFRGFSSDFYLGYDEVWALHSGYKYRKMLYNLYHCINHYNLFAGSYGIQAQSIIDKILSYL